MPPQRCPAIDITIGNGEHIAVEVVRRMLVAWFIVLPHLELIVPKLRQAWRRTWFRLAEVAEVDKPWSRVTGPNYALIVTMAQYGWQLSPYDRWLTLVVSRAAIGAQAMEAQESQPLADDRHDHAGLESRAAVGEQATEAQESQPLAADDEHDHIGLESSVG